LPYLRTQTTRQGKGPALSSDVSDEDPEDQMPRKGKVALSQAAKATQDPPGMSQVTPPHVEPQPMFLDSDEHDNESHSPNNDILGTEYNEDATLQSSALKSQEPSARSKPVSTRRVRKKAPVIVDDDSDDGATFKGFQSRKRGTR